MADSPQAAGRAEPIVRADPPRTLRAGLRAATALTRAAAGGRYAVADAMGLGAWTVLGGRRRNAVDAYSRLDPALGPRTARRRARASFREFARTAVDFLWANGMETDEVMRYSQVVAGKDLCDQATASGRGGILALTHFGNWDMAANIAFAIGLQLTTVMATAGPRAITELVIWARERNRLEVYEAENAARGLLRALRRNRFVAILSDVPEGGPTVEVEYCGGPVLFSSVPAWLAMRTGAALLPTACWREHGGYSIAALESINAAPGDDEQALMQRVARAVEKVVREHPTQWYPFRPVYADRGGPVVR